MKVVTVGGDVADLRFMLPRGSRLLATKAVGEVWRGSIVQREAAEKANRVEKGMWRRGWRSPTECVSVAKGPIRVEVHPLALRADGGRERIDAIASEFAVAISGAVGSSCEVKWLK